MDDSILSGDLRLAAHFAMPPTPGRSPGLVLCHGLPDDPRGATTVGTTYPELADHIARETGFVRAHVQLPRYRHVGGRLLRRRLARRSPRRSDRARGARRRPHRVARGLRPRRNVRGVRSRVRRPRARRRDDRRAEHVARLGTRPRAHAGPRARDGHDPDAGFSDRRAALGPGGRARRRGRGRTSNSTGARSSCSTGSTIPTFPSTTLAPSPTPALRWPSSDWSRARATACATIPEPSPPCSAGSTARCPDPSARRRRGRRRARRRACARAGSAGVHPVASRRLVASPTSTGTSIGRTSSGSTASRSGRRATGEEIARDVGDRHAVPRAHVVDLPGFAALREEPVRTHDVTDVGVVADRFEVPDHDVVGSGALGRGDPRREPGHEEVGGLSGTSVVERAHADHVECTSRAARQARAPRPRPCSARTARRAGAVWSRAPGPRTGRPGRTPPRCRRRRFAPRPPPNWPRARWRYRRRSPVHSLLVVPRRADVAPRREVVHDIGLRRSRSIARTASASTMSTASAPLRSRTATSSPSDWRCAVRC